MIGDVLSADTAIPIASVGALFIGAITVTIWLVKAIGKIESRLDQLVTSKQFYAWIYKLQHANPDLKLPEDFP